MYRNGTGAVKGLCTYLAGANQMLSRHLPGMALRIKILREASGLTQEALAEKLNTTHATIQRWESGKRIPPANKIPLLAEALGVHPGELFSEMLDVHAARIARALSTTLRATWITAGEAMLRSEGRGPFTEAGSSRSRSNG